MQKSAPVLLVDIGSGFVEARVGDREVHTLVNASGKNATALETLALSGLRKSLESLQGVSPAPRVAHVLLRAPWYRARIIEGITEKSTEHPNRTRIESTLNKVYIQGIPTTSLYESEADTAFLKKIEEEVRRAFAGSQTTFHSFALTAASALRARSKEKNFAVIDVDTEMTDVSIVEEGRVLFSSSFPIGTLSLAQKLAGTGSLADASSRTSLYVRGELSEKEKARFAPLFEDAFLAWENGIEKVQEAGRVRFPKTIFLVSDKKEAEWFLYLLPEATGYPHSGVLQSLS